MTEVYVVAVLSPNGWGAVFTDQATAVHEYDRNVQLKLYQTVIILVVISKDGVKELLRYEPR